MEKRNFDLAGKGGWLLPAVLGLLLVIFARALTSAVEILLGIMLILSGATGLLGWWNTRKTSGRDSLVILVGSVLAGVLGVWILSDLHGFEDVIKYILGALLILSGAQWLFINRAYIGFNLVTVLSVVTMLLGIVIMFTHDALVWPIRIVGFGLILNAVCGALGVGPAGGGRP